MVHARLRLILLTGLLVGAAAVPSAAQNYLHTSGSKLVDGKGTVVRLTGLNWFGLETSNYCPHGLWAHSMGFYLDLVKAQGYNCLRLPFSNQLLEPGSLPDGIDYNQNPDLSNLTGLQILDQVIAGCRARGLKVILDRHRPDSQGQSAVWYTGGYPESRWISDWRLLAQRYLGNDTVIGCDLHNEPHGPAAWGDGSGNDWVLAAQRCGNAILGVNPNLLILVEGVEAYGGRSTWWGGQLAGAVAHPVTLAVPNRLVYSSHDYPASVYPQPWFSDPSYPANLPAQWDQTWGYLAKGQVAPILVGEFGSRLATQSDQQWFQALAAYIQANGLNFTFWSLNPDSGDTGGLLADDWTTVIAAKQQVLAPLQAPPIGTGGGSGTVPAAPNGLKAVPGNAQVTLSWQPSAGALTYNLYRGTAPGAEAALPVVAGLGGTATVQTGLANGKAYYFKVRALNANGASPLSAEAQATPTAGSSAGPLTVVARPGTNGPWWGEIDLTASATARIDTLTVTLGVQVTPGMVYGGMYNTVGAQLSQTHGGSPGTLTYAFKLAPGSSVAPGAYTFAAQYGSAGTPHGTAGDTYTVHYGAGGQTYFLFGHF